MRQLAARFRLSLSGVRDLLTRYRLTGDVTPKPPGGGYPAKLDPTRLALVRTAVEHQPDAPRQELCASLRTTAQLTVRPATRSRGLAKLGLPRKKTCRTAEQARPDIQQHRLDFLATRTVLAPADLVCLDDTGSNLARARDSARAPRGQRASATQPVHRGGRVTMLGALGLEGLGATLPVDGLTDGDVFVACLQKVLVPPRRPGQVVIMDNLKAHQVAGVTAACTDAQVSLLYLPPYSPDLAPIEECWSQVKAILRAKAARRRATLEQALADAFDTITATDARGWFPHAGYCVVSN